MENDLELTNLLFQLKTFADSLAPATISQKIPTHDLKLDRSFSLTTFRYR